MFDVLCFLYEINLGSIPGTMPASPKTNRNDPRVSSGVVQKQKEKNHLIRISDNDPGYEEK